MSNGCDLTIQMLIAMPNNPPGVDPLRNSIRIRFTYNGERVTENIDRTPTGANLKYAARLRDKIIRELDIGVLDTWRYMFPDSVNLHVQHNLPNVVRTMSESMELYFLEYVSVELAASTQSGYRKVINLITPHIGDYPWPEFGKQEFRDWFKENGRHASKKWINNILVVVRGTLDFEIEKVTEADPDAEIQNPLKAWSPITKKKGKKRAKPEKKPLLPAELAAIISVLNSTNRPQLANLVEFMCWTGLRPSELIPLSWSDVNMVNNTISVTKVTTDELYHQWKNGKIPTPYETPKTEAGTREVELLPPAVRALDRQREFTELKGEEIFQSYLSGQRWETPKKLSNGWKPICLRAKVGYRKMYSCRHTYASMMLSANENLMWVAEQMGHEDWHETARSYARFIKAAKHDRGAKAVALFDTEKATKLRAVGT